MKRTTYILIGLFVAGLCVLVGGMFVMYCLGETILFQSNKPARRTASPRTADLSGDLDDSNRDEYGRTWYLAGNSLLGVLPSKGEKNTFSCSEKVNEYLKMTVMGDTLKIVFGLFSD